MLGNLLTFESDLDSWYHARHGVASKALESLTKIKILILNVVEG